MQMEYMDYSLYAKDNLSFKQINTAFHKKNNDFNLLATIQKDNAI